MCLLFCPLWFLELRFIVFGVARFVGVVVVVFLGGVLFGCCCCVVLLCCSLVWLLWLV